MGRVIRAALGMTGLALGGWAALCLGCATSMFQAPDAPPDPAGQRALARLLEAGLDRARTDLAGRTVRLSVWSPDPAVSEYAAALAEGELRAAGGQISLEAVETVRLQIWSAGRDRTERNFLLPLGQYVRFPLYYGQDDAGEIRALLALSGPGVEKTWDLSAARTGRTSYVFRILGPFGNEE